MNTQTFATLTLCCAALPFPASAQNGREHGKDHSSENRGADNHGVARQPYSGRPSSTA